MTEKYQPVEPLGQIKLRSVRDSGQRLGQWFAIGMCLAPWRLAAFPSSSVGFFCLGKGEIGRLMAERSEQEQAAGGTLHAAISHAVVGLLREYTGRGPTKSRTTIRENVVLVMLEQTLTKGEQSLVNKGRGRQGARDPARVPRGDARGKHGQGQRAQRP